MSEGAASDPEEARLETLRRTLCEHDVSFAVLFGSAVRESVDEPRDLDVAIEFDDRRPWDDGYSDAYLRLLTVLEDRLSEDVDLVAVHTASPQFLEFALDRGRVLVGSEGRRSALLEASPIDGSPDADGRERVAAAVDRLREGRRDG